MNIPCLCKETNASVSRNDFNTQFQTVRLITEYCPIYPTLGTNPSSLYLSFTRQNTQSDLKMQNCGYKLLFARAFFANLLYIAPLFFQPCLLTT
jgi:hypothetical protein